MPRTIPYGRLRILALLQAGEALTARRGAELAALSVPHARDVLEQLHRGERVTYVKAWRRENGTGRWSAEYAYGTRMDAPRPKPMTVAERVGLHRKRLQLQDERHDFMMSSRRARRRMIRPDPIAMRLLPWLYSQTVHQRFLVSGREEVESE